MKRISIASFAVAFAAAFALAAPGAGIAKEWKLTMGSSHPPFLPWTLPLKTLVVPKSNKLLQDLGGKDTIKWTEAYAGALYDFQNTLEGVGDGLAHIGWVGSLWEPVKMPLHNVTFYAPFVSVDVNSLMEIQGELEKLPAFAAEWTKNNTVFLGAQVADSYHLVTKFPVTSIDDLKGKKLIAPGAIANVVQGLGATPVDAGLPVFFNMMQTGVADGCVIITTGILPFKLHEVAPYITKVGIGGPISGGLAMNKDTWESLPEHMKKIFRTLGTEYSIMNRDLVIQREKAAWATLEKQGAKVSEMSLAERKRWANALPDVAGQWVKRNGAAAKAVLKAFMDGAQKRGEKPLRDWTKGI